MKVAVRMRSDFRPEASPVSPLVAFIAGLLALLLQGYLPMWFPTTTALALPLLVTLYLSLTRRSQIHGIFAGAIIGLAQDSLSHGPIGLFGMAKTIVGYTASSLGARIDTDHPGIRLLVVFAFYYIHLFLLLGLQDVLLQKPFTMPGPRSLAVAVVNAIIGVIVFQLLDHFRRD